jgi:small multidrug resistance pump
MTYVLLAAAILCEVAGTLSLRASEGFSKPAYAITFVVGYLIAFTLLAIVLNRGLPVSVTYALWAGTGVALVAALSVPIFGESISGLQVAGFVLVIGGVVAIELGGAH